jgi:site-specific DNA-cytosine methylase
MVLTGSLLILFIKKYLTKNLIEMKPINVLSLFDGISCGQIALERAGIPVNKYYASEIDKHAIKVTQHNYPNTIQLGSVTELKNIEWDDIDLLIGGSPCQSFSRAGDGSGFDGKSGLFWEYVRVLNEVKPKYFLLENVIMKKEWEDVISDALGVKPIEINSNLVSAQNRRRLYWTNILNIEQPEDKDISLSDILEDVDFRELKPFVYGFYGKTMRIDKMKDVSSKKANCLTTSKSHTNQYYLNESRDKMRNLTISEYEKLQTIPIGYTNVISEGERYKAIGNGWTVDVIAHIFKNIKN